MNVWAVTYGFNDIEKTLLIESAMSTREGVKDSLHPAIYNKVIDIEFVGTLA